MAPTAVSEKPKFNWLQTGATVLGMLLSIGGTALVVGRYQERVDSVSKAVDTKVSKETYDTDQKSVVRTLDQINKTVEDIRKDQIEDLRRQAERRR